MHLIDAYTIDEAWRSALELFAEGHAQRLSTRFGVSFDLVGLAIDIHNPADATLPKGFRYPELVAAYVDRVTGAGRSGALLHQRLREWPSDSGSVDQLEAIEAVLREQPGTRHAVFGLWDPAQDSKANKPASPVSGAFRICGGDLHLFLLARSVDVTVGLVPELIAFARLQQDLAGRLSLRQGPLHYVAWSAHVYETDYIAFGRTR